VSSHEGIAKAGLAEMAVAFAKGRLAMGFFGRFAFASAVPFHLN